jgi:hypothetical protein
MQAVLCNASIFVAWMGGRSDQRFAPRLVSAARSGARWHPSSTRNGRVQANRYSIRLQIAHTAAVQASAAGLCQDDPGRAGRWRW